MKQSCNKYFRLISVSFCALGFMFLLPPSRAHATATFQAYDVLGQQDASNLPNFTTNNADNYLGVASTTNAQGLLSIWSNIG
jgi:hypothetical protein